MNPLTRSSSDHGSRITKALYDLAEYFEKHGDYFTDHQILESTRKMGQGKDARDRRIVDQWRFARSKRDNKNINAMIAKAEKIVSGQVPFSRARLLKITGEAMELNQETVDRAWQLAGLKGSRCPGRLPRPTKNEPGSASRRSSRLCAKPARPPSRSTASRSPSTL